MPKYKRFIFWRDGLNEPKIDYRIEETHISWEDVLAILNCLSEAQAKTVHKCKKGK